MLMGSSKKSISIILYAKSWLESLLIWSTSWWNGYNIYKRNGFVRKKINWLSVHVFSFFFFFFFFFVSAKKKTPLIEYQMAHPKQWTI